MQEDNQAQRRSNGAVVDCGSAEGKVIGDFGIDTADASGAVVASVQNKKGKKTRAGNAKRKIKSVVVQSLEDSNKKCRRGSCDKTFLCKSGELQHGKKCRGTNKFQCVDCNKIFRNGRNLLQHRERKNLANKMRNCERCTQKFCLDWDLILHEKREHNYKRKFKCGSCYRQYVSSLALKFHERIHDPEQCICQVCGKSLKDSYALKKHGYTHKDVNDVECSYCVQCFRSQNSLTQHMIRFHPDEYKKMKSQKINKKKNKRVKVNAVSTRETEISDILKKQMYEEKRPFKCEECPKRYVYQCSLKKHIKNHESKKLRTTSEYHKKTLNILEIQIQDEEKLFECEKCHKVYEHRRSLERHRKAAHDAKGPCTVSERHEGISEPLEKQMHDNEKPFQCEKCPGKYKYERSFKRHARIHESDKPYVCEQCNKSFASACMLTQHEREHVMKKDFTCSPCGMLAKSPDRLGKHKRRYHSDKQEKSTKTNNNGSKEVNVNSVSKHQKGILEDLGKQNAEGDLVVDQLSPVIEQSSTSGSYIDESRIDQECGDGQIQEWSTIFSEWQTDELNRLCNEVLLDVDGEAVIDFNGEGITDFSDELLIGDI